MKLWLSLMIVTIFIGCSTSVSKPQAEIKEKPKSPSYIIIDRKWHFFAGGRDFDIHDNKEFINQVKNGEKLKWKATPGKHCITVKTNADIKMTKTCFILNEEESKTISMHVFDGLSLKD